MLVAETLATEFWQLLDEEDGDKQAFLDARAGRVWLANLLEGPDITERESELTSL